LKPPHQADRTVVPTDQFGDPVPGEDMIMVGALFAFPGKHRLLRVHRLKEFFREISGFQIGKVFLRSVSCQERNELKVTAALDSLWPEPPFIKDPSVIRDVLAGMIEQQPHLAHRAGLQLLPIPPL
jgi:hypothetical protein